MDTVLIVDSLQSDIEFVVNDHNQVLGHNHFLNASLDNLEALMSLVIVVVAFVA